ncbi:hypothetical protein PsYK624_136270 [Phanerochaete sordida]|uniref:Uncharacterized protein n=1 Tax=Phanerochaete sordida TaxID=48140 RepID=A0A9P3GPY1_9APHY|nr:hypothetical protein PsYK624_136270 [Phanerochaete sordida]
MESKQSFVSALIRRMLVHGNAEEERTNANKIFHHACISSDSHEAVLLADPVDTLKLSAHAIEEGAWQHPGAYATVPARSGRTTHICAPK